MGCKDEARAKQSGLRHCHGSAARSALGHQLPRKAGHECQAAPPAVPARCQQGFKPASVL